MADASPPVATSADGLDPEIRRFHDIVSAGFAHHPGFDGLPFTERRRIAEEVRRPWRQGGPPMHGTDEHRVGELATRIRIYRPRAAATLAPLIYLHGGGWTIFSLDTHDRLMREYAARADVAVIGVDYSLSPEARFPRALEEIVSVVEWLRSKGAAHGLDGGRVAIGGDSAGANLAVTANLRLRALGAPLLAAMLLNYGAFDSQRTPSHARYDGPAYMLTVEEMDGFWRNYVRTDADLADPLVCPLRADLRGLPATFLAIAECDILADANRDMAERLRASGVRVDARVYRGATHSFLEAVSIAAIADRALSEASDWLRGVLHGGQHLGPAV
jgi:acetyl esterase